MSVRDEDDRQKREESYIKGGGVTCPFCHSYNITAGHIEAESGTAWSEVECKDCKSCWQDVYNLVGVTEKEMV